MTLFGVRWGRLSSQITLALAALFEVGKSRIEAIGEAEEAVDLADYYATQMEERQGYRQLHSGARRLHQLRRR